MNRPRERGSELVTQLLEDQRIELVLELLKVGLKFIGSHGSSKPRRSRERQERRPSKQRH